MLVPLSISLVLLVLGVALGVWEAKRLRFKYKDLQLETLHHQARYIYVLIGVVALTFVGIVLPMTDKMLMWNAPMWFDRFGNSLLFIILTGCFSFLFCLASTVAVMTGHKERKGIILASILIVFMLPGFQYRNTAPVYPELNPIKMYGVILQSHPSSCAAASGANIAYALGKEKTEKEMARLMNTSTMSGTSAGEAIYGLAQAGIRCSKKWVEDSDAKKFAAPGMFFIDNELLGPESHAVAFMGYEGDKLEIWDPLEGKQLHTPKEVQKFWHGKGLECSLAG